MIDSNLTMQVGKWGDNLTVRLPATIVEALNIKEGDEIKIEIADHRTLRIIYNYTREDALAELRTLSRSLPPGFRFSRDEANERTE